MRFRDSLAEQFKRNSVALISLVFAMTTLGYTSWRMEHSEENQNIRAAGFEILMQLGKLQLNVDYSYYGEDDERGNPISAWTHVLLIRDLSRIMPGDMPDKADKLFATWQENWQHVRTSESHTEAITAAITEARQATLESLESLD